MRFSLPVLIGAIVLAAAPASTAPRLAPEAKLARALEGREAGTPVDCIRLRDIRGSRIIDRTAIIYEGVGGTLYVNRPDAGASSLGYDDMLVTKTTLGQLCSVDVVQLYDRSTQMPTGAVFLGEFVPYHRPGSRRAR